MGHGRTLAAGTAALALVRLGVVAHVSWAIFTLWRRDTSTGRLWSNSRYFVAAGAGLLLLATADLYRNKTADALLLFLWVAGTLVFVLVACRANQWPLSFADAPGSFHFDDTPAGTSRKSLHDRNHIGPLWVPLGVSLAIA